MVINRKLVKKIKRIFQGYNIAILVCTVLIIGSLYIILKPTEKVTPSGIKVVDTNVKESNDMTEEEARKATVKQFKEVGENVKEDQLNVRKIMRNGEEYYFISSAKNTLEIKIKGGTITRINSATVDE